MHSVTPIDSGDPRLTAYVLGELSVSEAHAVEAWLLKSPEARAEIQGIREMVSLIRGGFAAELERAGAVPAQPKRAELTLVRSEAPASPPSVESPERVVRIRRFAAVGTGLAAAAALVLAVTSPRWMSPGGVPESQLAADLPPFGGTIPGISRVDEADGIYLASAGGVAPDLRLRNPAADPVITEVRFLSDDPAQVRQFPLTSEMMSYLPAPRVMPIAPVPAARQAGNLYLDSDRFHNPELGGGAGQDDYWSEEPIWANAEPAAVAALDDRTAEAVQRAAELQEAGRQLFLAKEYEASVVVFQQALDELPKVGTDGSLRAQIEALLSAARKMSQTSGGQ